MKKKGFTLIELLAVIVILAIIALIAIPLVLKYIEKSRQESKVDSAYSFVRNLETEMANYAIKHNGTKYTTDKENIKELDLNTTVKGENPEDGKVCISSVGQIEKGIFKYNNYYIGYDGKKATISDRESFDNFKCDKNNSNANNDVIVFDDDIEFTYNEEAWAYMVDQCFDQTKFKNNANYRVTIDDNETYEAISVFGKYYGEDGFGLASKYKIGYVQVGNNCMLFNLDESLNFNSQHKIKIEYINDDVYPHYLTFEDDELSIFSLVLEVGTAVVEIKDNNGNISNFNVEVEDDELYRVIHITNYNTNYLASKVIKPYYDLLQNGGIVTVTVTQGENVYVLGGTEFTFEDDYLCDGDIYYWGNHNLGYWFGC